MSGQDGYPGAPPGWYADPAGGPGQRWWDGYAWTGATVLPTQAPPPPWAGAAPPQQPPAQIAPWAAAAERFSSVQAAQKVEDERGAVRLARIAAAVPGLYFLIGLLLQKANTPELRSAAHQLRIDWHDAQHNIKPPQYHPPSNGWASVSLLVLLVTIGAVIIACIWQHKAAVAARALGIPSSYSPGWGVGCWFVPIVNLWMPYGALRACLPPGDPRRAHVLRWWLALYAAWLLSVASTVAVIFSSTAGLIVAIPAALACLAVIAWAPRVVTDIAAVHQEALAGQTTPSA